MRNKNFVLGLIIILIGFVLLLNQMLPHLALGKFIFPVILILLGLWFLAGPILFKKIIITEQYKIPLETTASANIQLYHGAGHLTVEALDTPDDLLRGEFKGGVDKNIERNEQHLDVKLKTPPDIFMSIPAMHQGGLNWQLFLSREIPLNLDVRGGANETKMDLRDLKVARLLLETGASSTTITLPAAAGFIQVEVNAGAASVSIRIPDNLAARISTRESSMASISIDQDRFPQNQDIYETPEYSSAVNKANIIIKTGVGSVDIR